VRAGSGKDLCNALERKGWRLLGARGSHHIYASPEGSVVVSVPVHGSRTCPRGQHGTMKSAGLTEADL
jgi:predicted RNA binding protein YcfA (HicA-like mRNA interferase family)